MSLSIVMQDVPEHWQVVMQLIKHHMVEHVGVGYWLSFIPERPSVETLQRYGVLKNK